MKNIQLIFLSILRFFKQNVVSLIGFMLLVFFSVSIFTTLNGVTTSLLVSFNRIKIDGNLHDFVINENYTIGNPNFISVVELTLPKTYNYTFHINRENWTGGHEKTLLEFKEWISKEKQNEFSKFFLGNEGLFFYFDGKFVDTVTSNTPQAESLGLPKNIIATTKEGAENKAKEILNIFLLSSLNELVPNVVPVIFKNEIITQTKNNVVMRDFNALDVSSNKQNVYFKIIETNNDFDIDNLVMFEGNNVSPKEDFSNFVTSLQKEYDQRGKEFFMGITPTNDVKPNEPLPENASIETTILHWTWNYIELFLKASWTPGFLNDDQTNLLNMLNDDIYAKVNPWRNSPLDLSYFEEKWRNLFEKLFVSMNNFLANNSGFSIINTGFSLTFSQTSFIPAAGVINDINSFEAIATPSYFEKNFINEKTKETYKKEPIDINLWNKIKSVANEDELQRWLDDDVNGLQIENKLEVDNEFFVLLGSGLSPDFMYPIVNQNRPIPDQSQEEIVYVSPSGYVKMSNNFRGTLTETFIVGKSDGGNLIDQIFLMNEISKNFMSWPTDIDSTYANDDLSNIFSPASQRVVFVPTLIDSISLISLFLTSFITLLTLFVIGIMIKRFIQINKTDLSILLANGFSKREIILALTLAMLLFGGIATSSGILIGISLQTSAIGLFSQFLTIPILISNLTIGLFFSVLGAAMLIFGSMSLLFSYFSLKGDVVSLMKDDSNYHLNKLSKLIKKSVKRRSVLTIFRVSLAFSSPWKIISISTMSGIVMSSISFGISNIDKFGSAARNTFESKKYENAIELYSPTNAGGLYYTTPIERASATLFDGLYNFNENIDMNRYNELVFNQRDKTDLTIDPNAKIFVTPINQNLIGVEKGILTNKYTNKTASIFSLTDYNMTLNGNLHLPTLQDATASLYDLSYVEYMTSSKLSLEQKIIFFVPWSIASKLMPSNTRRYFDENYELLLEEVYRNNTMFDAKDANPNNSLDWIPESFEKALLPFVTNTKINENNDRSKFKLTYTEGGEIKPFYLDGDRHPYNLTKIEINPTTNIARFPAYGFINETINFSFKLKENFINLIFGIEKNNFLSPTNYSMNYKKISIGQKDETYTTVEFDILEKNGFSFLNQSLKARGIKNESTYVSLLNDGTDISSLINKDFPNLTPTIEVPIIANKFAEKSLNLKVGDILRINVMNDIWRFEHAANKVEEVIYNLKVVGFNDSFKDNEFYMSQENANLLTGFTSLQKPIEDFPIESQEILKNNEEWLYGFNGIFTPEINVTQATQNVGLYSPLNIYSGFDRVSDPKFIEAMKVTKTGAGLNNKEDSNFYEALERTKSMDLLKNYKDPSSPIIPTNDMIDSFVGDLILTYGGDSIFTSLLTSVEPVSVLENIFTNIQNITETLQWISLIVINIVSIVIIILITLIIISDSMKLAGILKALGLRSLSNASSFLMIYFPTITLGLIFAIPLTFLFNFIYSSLIFTFVGILISTATPWWVFLSSTSVIVIIFIISFLISWRKIKTQNLTQVIK